MGREIMIHGNINDLENITKDVMQFFVHQITELPGPQHPAVKYYKSRKLRNNCKYHYDSTSNPRRKAIRKKEQNKEKYEYEMAQYNFYNQRRKIAHKVLAKSHKRQICKIPTATITEHFEHIFSKENNNSPLLDSFTNDIPADITITEDDIHRALFSIKIDTSPGPDRITVRVLRHLKATKFLTLLTNAMLHYQYIPKSLKSARTILIHKGGAINDIKEWRPITIFSVIRRIIERVLDSKLRTFVTFNQYQHGFVPLPGTHINASIVNGCLQSAKMNKRDGCIVFLDVSKAFDSVGHEHLKRALKQSAIPRNLYSIIMCLLSDNTFQVEADLKKSKDITMKCGVPQGSPLSPTLFNLAMDYIMQNLTDHDIVEKYGYKITDDLPSLSALAFADDIAIISNNIHNATALTNLAESLFAEIGLNINPNKSKCINLRKGKLFEGNIATLQGSVIPSLKHKDERIRYLGIDFHDEISVDKNKIIKNLTSDLNGLVKSKLLKSDQKLKIINQYIWPTLIYPLQCAPLLQLSATFLRDLDTIIRSAVKELMMLPDDTPNAMLYSAKSVRGLGILNATWEANIQHFNICNRLLPINDVHLQHLRQVNVERKLALHKLNISEDTLPSNTNGNKLREILRARSFQLWCQLPHKGKGVVIYGECPKANSWMTSKKNLSTSEYINAIKMSTNLSAVRSVPGRTFNTTRCRHLDCNETETLGHVLGFCRKTELLRNNRHHRARSAIATFLKQRGWEVHEEVHCISIDDSTRRADIIAINRKNNNGLILDPTIRFERDIMQAQQVDVEKKAIYEPCKPFFSNKYDIHASKWTVRVILLGARGSLAKYSHTIFKDLGFYFYDIQNILIQILKDSLQILHYHLYFNG